MNRTIPRLGLCCILSLSACSEEPASEPFDPEPLQHAQTPDCTALANERLEGIGLLSVDNSVCTATLIGPNAILSAAHCFNHTSATPDEAGGRAKFEIDPWNHCGRHREVPIRSWISFAQSIQNGRNIDLAVAQLDGSISSVGAVKHFTIATAYPASGTQVTMYGRGYTGDGWQDMWWGDALRRASVPYDLGAPAAEWVTRVMRESPAGTSYLDHGDSGGPVLSASGEIFALNAAINRNLNGKDLEYFADAVELNRRTALPWIVKAFSSGIDWPNASNNGWACADGKLAFCDADHSGYLRECSDATDLFAVKRKYCPGGCASDACVPHACEGKVLDACSNDPSCTWHLATCGTTNYSGCLPDGLTGSQVCAAFAGETFGSAPTTGGSPSSGGAGCCTNDNMCANPPNTTGCAMTSPGGYCDPNGDGSFTDADWVKGYEEHQVQCGGSTPTDPPPNDPPPTTMSCPCTGDNRCANPPNTAGCPMTSPGGYCDPNGDGNFTDGDWTKGWYDHQGECG